VKKTLFYLWQLPQHLLALAFWGLLKLCGWESHRGSFLSQPVIVLKTRSFGLSLGEYIFVGLYEGRLGSGGFAGETVKHEHGHTIQSRRLGPLYLLLVGLPSISRNIWDRKFHRGWPPARREAWYYGAWPENQADRLGGVLRRYI